jgi:hypothetical protein
VIMEAEPSQLTDTCKTKCNSGQIWDLSIVALLPNTQIWGRELITSWVLAPRHTYGLFTGQTIHCWSRLAFVCTFFEHFIRISVTAPKFQFLNWFYSRNDGLWKRLKGGTENLTASPRQPPFTKEKTSVYWPHLSMVK